MTSRVFATRSLTVREGESGMSMSVGWATIASKIVPGANLACFPLMKMSGTKTTTASVTDRAVRLFPDWSYPPVSIDQRRQWP